MNKFKISEFSIENLFEDLEKGMFSNEFTLKDLGISARVLQNWSERGVLPEKKRKEDENHRFNFIDLIWMKLVVELRDVGIPLHRIKKVKTVLYDKQPFLKMLNITENDNLAERLYPIFHRHVKSRKAFFEIFSDPEIMKKAAKMKFSYLHFILMMFVDNRYHVKFLVFNDGNVAPYIHEIHGDNPELTEYIEKNTHVSVPLFNLVLNFIEDEKNIDFLGKGVVLNENEMQIFMAIRSGKYKKIAIQFKNKELQFFETTELVKLNKEARLSEILLSKGYEKIEIITQGGVMSYSPQTQKHILK